MKLHKDQKTLFIESFRHIVIVDLDKENLGFYCIYDDDDDDNENTCDNANIWYKNVDFFAIKKALDKKIK